MNSIAVIPARYASSRFPGKPLQKLLGKPMLQWVIEGAKSSQQISEVVVASDHKEIISLAESCGVRGVMTSDKITTGSDRVWAVAKDMQADSIVNIQGDEPLITGAILDELLVAFQNNANSKMATLAQGLEKEDLHNKNAVKVISNQNNEAIYFSRLGVPFSRSYNATQNLCLKHIGLYAYKRDFLEEFCSYGPCALEQAEGLEQLRALYLGAKIVVQQINQALWGVDSPEDVARVEEILAKG